MRMDAVEGSAGVGDAAGVGAHKPTNGVEKGGLAGAVGPDHGTDLVDGDRDGNLVQGHNAPEPDRQVSGLEGSGLESRGGNHLAHGRPARPVSQVGYQVGCGKIAPMTEVLSV